MQTTASDTTEDIAARALLTKTYNSKELTLTPKQIVFLNTKFSSKLWRMDNLYTILDKSGKKRILKLNPSQKKILTQFKHNKKVIPKSRQQGISTLFLAYYLDACITTPGYQAGIQSYGRDEAEKLSKRALLMWSDLDPDVKALLDIKLVSNNSKGMTFSNGSILKIGNFRGDTLQGLHVSELAKIAKKYPDKAKELKTGAFQAVSADSKITIESTAEGASGLFYEIVMQAKALRDIGAELTPLDFQLIFIGWLEDPDCQMQQTPNVTAGKKYLIDETNSYFAKLEKQLNIVITQEQRNWYLAKKIELGPDMKQEYPATIEEAFEQSVHGTIYKDEYALLYKENRVLADAYIPNIPVTVSFDIGVNDETVLLFQQVHKGIPYIFECYSNSGQNLEYYADIIWNIARKYNFIVNDVIFPHDGNVKEFIAGKTRIDHARYLGLPVRLLPKGKLLDGIEETRQYLRNVVIDSSLDKLLSAIQLYRWKYDKQLDVTLQTPLHDWTSNYCDSLRYMALGGYYDSHIHTVANDYVYEGI